MIEHVFPLQSEPCIIDQVTHEHMYLHLIYYKNGCL